MTSILIVDDEKNMRTTLADILGEEGYEVSTAESGEAAVALCRRQAFDVVLMDVRMPGMDGVEAFRRIRRLREGIRVIMMSAYSVERLRNIALEEGAIAFLRKPLDLEKVASMIGEGASTAILVVEKDEGVVGQISAGLRKRGYRVTVAGSPEEALELADQIRFDVIFIGADLPAMSGLELYLAIREITPTSLAIMIAGMEAELEVAEEAVRQTAYTIVRKPVDMDQILSLLRRIRKERAAGTLSKPPRLV